MIIMCTVMIIAGFVCFMFPNKHIMLVIYNLNHSLCYAVKCIVNYIMNLPPSLIMASGRKLCVCSYLTK